MSAAEAFTIRLFQPLGLTETFQPPAENTSLPAPYARGYHYGAIVTESDTDEGAVQTAIQPAVAGSATLLVDASDWNTSWGDTAGMGISTASELALYVERMIGGGYLDKDLQKRRLESCIATNPADPDPNALHYGWGIGRTGTFYGHTGELPGYNTFMVHDPVAKTTVVVWTSMSAGPGGRLPAVEIGGLIVAELSKP
jgi:D-alanyl-D-alanine carboxypeptidase